MSIYPVWKTQIVLLIAKKVNILIKYLDFVDVLLKKFAVKLFEHFNINKHLINLEPDIQSLYEPFYNLRPVELEILKTYIKTNFVNNFIWFSNSPAKALIQFIKKPDSSPRLYMD